MACTSALQARENPLSQSSLSPFDILKSGDEYVDADGKLACRLQELQADLSQVMHLRHRAAEYQLAYYPPNGSQYVRHRDAFPDDGSEEYQRRVRSPIQSVCGSSKFHLSRNCEIAVATCFIYVL